MSALGLLASTSVAEGRHQLTPDGLEGDIGLVELVHNLLQDGPVLVAPAALVKAKGPVLLHGGQADGALLVRRRHVLGCGPGVEVEVDASAQSTPGDAGRPEQHLLRVGIALEEAVRQRLVLDRRVRSVGHISRFAALIFLVVSSIQVDGVVPVDVAIQGVTGVCREQGS